jgi:hypothetical protein
MWRSQEFVLDDEIQPPAGASGETDPDDPFHCVLPIVTVASSGTRH